MTLEFLLARARRKGTNKQFLDWLSYQASCIDGSWNQWDTDKGEGRTIACHVRRVKDGAGTGTKPDYCAVPMSGAQHCDQSWHGEAACLNKWLPRKGFWSDLEAKAQFDEWRIYYLTLWINS